MKSIALLRMPMVMGMGRAAFEYEKIFKKMGYEVKCMEWYDFMTGRRKKIEPADVLFSFVVPQPSLLNLITNIVNQYKKTYGMTVWETEEVPFYFKSYAQLFDVMFAPSHFTANMFTPALTFLPHHVSSTSYALKEVNTGVTHILATPGYKFYSISDFADSRKNVTQLVKGFLECNLVGAKLVLKHNRDVPKIADHPNIINLVGELTDKDLEFMHDVCHCYVNMSFSEGVGLGILEAAIRDKPIIMTDYGGQTDYVETPWLVKTQMGSVGFDEFLYTKNMKWGIPDHDDYKRMLKDVYDKSVKKHDHQNTRKLVSMKNIRKILKKQGL